MTALMQNALVLSEQSNIANPMVEVREQAFKKITAPIRLNHGLGRIDPSQATLETKQAVTSLLFPQFPDPLQAQADHPLDQNTYGPGGEELSSYVSALIEAVLELHDPGSIPLLYKPDILTSGRMATSALGYFGHTEASRIVELYKRARPGSYRVSLEMTIFSMLNQHTLDSSLVRSDVEAIFLRQSYSALPDERLMASTGLSFYPDASSRNRLAELASHDPAVFVTYASHERHYEVRERAAMALRAPVDIGDSR